MKKLLLIATLAFLAFRSAPCWAASDEYDDSQSNPLRIVAYLAYPVGFAAEWLVMRPFHFLVSATPAQEALFGHQPHPPMFTEPESYYYYGAPNRVPIQETPPAPTAAQPATQESPGR